MHGPSPADSPHELVVLVGDRLTPSGDDREGLIRYSDFLASVERGRYDASPPTRLKIVTGQGIGRYETDHLQRELKRRNLDSTVERSLGNDTDLSLAGRHEVHKDSQRNVLVCDVRQVGAGRYQAGLYIDNDNELVLDHATGRHIPGMVVMEATRQMARVSAERQLDGRTTGGGYQWVVHSCNTEFRGFLFPLPVLLECEISQAGRHRPNQSRFQATVSLCQGGRATVVSTMEFAAYRERTLERAERMQATRAVQETVANLSARPS